MTLTAARHALFTFAVLSALLGSGPTALAGDSAGSAQGSVVLRAVVLPSLGVQLASMDSSQTGEAKELAAHWNLASGHNAGLIVARSTDWQYPFASAHPAIIPAKYRIGTSCLQSGEGFSADWCDSLRPFAVVGLASLGRQQPKAQPMRISLPRLAFPLRHPESGTLDIRFQAI
ncbi:MAG TPA: hypothetical protein VLE48_08880 [Terriglobales bacterium]|nr:hypothetical protein [Terriglobales bacterium]